MSTPTWVGYFWIVLIGLYIVISILSVYINTKDLVGLKKRQKDEDALCEEWQEVYDAVRKAKHGDLFSRAPDPWLLPSTSNGIARNVGELRIEAQAYQALTHVIRLWQRLGEDDMSVANRYQSDEANYTIRIDRYGAKLTSQDGISVPREIAFAPATSDKVQYNDLTRQQREIAWYALSGLLLDYVAWYAVQHHYHGISRRHIIEQIEEHSSNE